MNMIPEVKCRRCGATFSSLRSRCPNCGTRRVAQSGRSPGTTPGTVKGTAAYERAEANTKWQMIFGLILVVAVILAVIVMVSTTLDGADNVGSKVTPPIAQQPGISGPVIEAPPTLPPTPPPTVERVVIKDGTGTNEITDFTIHVDQVVSLKAEVYPLTIQGVTVNWTAGDDTLLEVVSTSDDGRTIECKIIGSLTQARSITLTAECGGMEASTWVRCNPNPMS